MMDVVAASVKLNQDIKETEVYKTYVATKKRLYDNVELCQKLKEFRIRNFELQNRVGVNSFDEVGSLVREYDALLHNSIVNEFLVAEQKFCKMMRKVYNSISDGLEFDYLDEQH